MPTKTSQMGLQRVLYVTNPYINPPLANHNTPAQTNQSEPTACFWWSGFIDSGSQPVVQMTEEKAAYN